jgi:hypothetical protein
MAEEGPQVVEVTVYGNIKDITHGTPILSGCQYRQQSVLTYNVSATIPQADFRCETGGTSTPYTPSKISCRIPNITATP